MTEFQSGFMSILTSYHFGQFLSIIAIGAGFAILSGLVALFGIWFHMKFDKWVE